MDFITSENFIPYASFIIAFAAFFLAIKESIQNKIHLRKSVKPILDVETDENLVQNQFILSVVNNGLGPAIIDNLNTKFENETVVIDTLNKRISNYLDFHKSNSTFNLNMISIDTTSILKEGVSREFLRFEFVNHGSIEKKIFHDLINKFSLDISYTDIYEERFELNFNQLEMRKAISLNVIAANSKISELNNQN
jgi:hypothetical protein